MQNVHNISLIGNSTNYISPVEIDCWRYSSITIVNSSMVTIKNFVIAGNYYLANLHLKVLNCYYAQLHNVTMNRILIGHNIMGESVLSNITSNGIDITYDDNISVKSVNIHKLIICNYTTTRELYVKMEQNFYEVSIIITSSTSSYSITVLINSSCTPHENTIVFNKIHFLNRNRYGDRYISIHFSTHNHHCSNRTICIHDKVIIKNCLFLNNLAYGNIVYTKWLDTINETKQNVIIENCFFAKNSVHGSIIYSEWYHKITIIGENIVIKGCVFKNNTIRDSILSFYSHHTEISDGVYIIGSKFVFNTCIGIVHYYKYPFEIIECAAVVTSNVMVQLEGPIIVHNNVLDFLFGMKMYSTVLFHKYIEFSQNKGQYMIYGSYVILLETVTLNISENDVSVLFFKNESDINSPYIPLCYFQFYGNKKNMTNKTFEIEIRHSDLSMIFNQNAEDINCKMLPGSLFYKHNPLYVYQQFIHIQNDLGEFSFPFNTGMVCYCSIEEIQPNCYINTLGPIFPGQTLTIRLCINFITENFIPIFIDVDRDLPKSHCKVLLSNQIFIWITRNCTEFHFTILSNNEQQCELFLNAKANRRFTIFYVKLLKCPMGFSFNINTGKCECDLLMNSKLLKITSCNINDQTIL